MHIYNFSSCILDFVVLLCKICLHSTVFFMLPGLQYYFSFSILLFKAFSPISIFNTSTILLNNMASINIFCFVLSLGKIKLVIWYFGVSFIGLMIILYFLTHNCFFMNGWWIFFQCLFWIIWYNHMAFLI